MTTETYWHGGPASPDRDRFMALDQVQRMQANILASDIHGDWRTARTVAQCWSVALDTIERFAR